MIMKWCRWRAASLALMVLNAPGLLASGREAWAQSGDRSPASAARSQIRALGRLEPESGVIVVGARPGVRIEKLPASEGQDVSMGDVLAVLEGHDQRANQLALAEAQRDAAHFQRRMRREQLALERTRFDRLKQPRLDSLRATVKDLRSKLGGTSSEGRKADADGKGKDAQEKPATPSFGGGMVPPIVTEMLVAQLRAELSKTEIELKELEVTLELLDRQRKLEDEQFAEHGPDLIVLDRQVDLARTELAQTEVRAPVAGRVLALVAHAGEVSAGPVLTLGDVSTMIARAEVFESDVLDVATGNPAQVTILGRTVTGAVTRIGSTVGRNTITSLDPTALADRRVVDVVVRLSEASPASRLVNMQVDVAIPRQKPVEAAK